MQLKTKRLENQRQRQQEQSSTSSTTSTVNNNNNTQFNFSQIFPVGSQVEVSSDDEGFKGAWYLATVLNPPSSSFSPSQLYVEYNNLLSEENGSALLKEFVDVSFVRPKPPLDEKVDSFDVNDVVDAFYLDGWWTGVVTQVVNDDDDNGKCRKYKVFFSSPPDEMEFEPSDLRVHRIWFDGNWVLPQNQRMRELYFSSGTAVEVNIDPDNSSDVWFPATFIKQVTSNSFLVEYQSSSEAGRQKVAVDSLHIRPSPPPLSNRPFNLLEKVDAFYDCRWLSGVVTKILADGRYIVYFKRTKKEKELCQTDLRLHMEWTNGKWVHNSQDTSMASNSKKKSDYAVNGGYKEKNIVLERGTGQENVEEEERVSALTLKSCQKVRQTPSIENVNHNSTTHSKRIKKTSANGDSIYLNPPKRLSEKTVSDVAASPEACNSNMKETGGSNNGKPADLDTSSPNIPEKSSIEQLEECNQPSASPEIKENDEKFTFSRKRGRGRPRKIRTILSDIDGMPLRSDVVSPRAPIVLRSDVVSPLGPIVLGLTHNGKMAGSPGQFTKEELKKVVEDDEKRCDTSADHEGVVNNGGEDQRDVVTNLLRKRGRGRPPKVLFRVGSPKAKEAEHLEEGKHSVSDVKDTPLSDAKDSPLSDANNTHERHSPVNEVEKTLDVVEPVGISDSAPSTESRKRSLRIVTNQIKSLNDIHKLNTRSRRSRPRKFPKITATEEMNEPVRLLKLKRPKRHRLYKQVEPKAEDAVDNKGQRVAEIPNNGIAKDVEKVVAASSSNVSDDDRPLSTWFEGAHSPPRTDGRLPQAGTAGHCDDIKMQPAGQPKEKAQEKRDEKTLVEHVSQYNNVLERQDEIETPSSAIVPMNNHQDLPFVKNSLIWEMIESMEVFKRIPQKPHFRPLYNCKEECREGLAIGNMVTFSSLVEKVSKLRFDDPKSLIDGYLEALVDLEELGFNVAPVRDQLNTLLSIKGRFEQAQNTFKEIESQIVEQSHEKEKIDEEIFELDKKIAELNEKRALAMTKKDMKDAEIKVLQTSVDTMKASLESAEVEFEKVTASLR